ncbi:MAG TPA: hypothetical protein DEQ00_17240 [Mycobacterium tuberculosis]|nr:hypothetical protein [Mycobacterium tuberculosis]
MAQDHEEEVRIRWGETVDELHAALDRAGPRPGTWCNTTSLALARRGPAQRGVRPPSRPNGCGPPLRGLAPS